MLKATLRPCLGSGSASKRFCIFEHIPNAWASSGRAQLHVHTMFTAFSTGLLDIQVAMLIEPSCDSLGSSCCCLHQHRCIMQPLQSNVSSSRNAADCMQMWPAVHLTPDSSLRRHRHPVCQMVYNSTYAEVITADTSGLICVWKVCTTTLVVSQHVFQLAEHVFGI